MPGFHYTDPFDSCLFDSQTVRMLTPKQAPRNQSKSGMLASGCDSPNPNPESLFNPTTRTFSANAEARKWSSSSQRLFGILVLGTRVPPKYMPGFSNMPFWAPKLRKSHRRTPRILQLPRFAFGVTKKGHNHCTSRSPGDWGPSWLAGASL